MEDSTRTTGSFDSSFSENDDRTTNKTAAIAHVAVDKVSNAAVGALRRAMPAIERTARSAHYAIDETAPATQRLKERGDKAVVHTRLYVAANPLKALGIAAVVGLVIGHIL